MNESKILKKEFLNETFAVSQIEIVVSMEKLAIELYKTVLDKRQCKTLESIKLLLENLNLELNELA